MNVHHPSKKCALSSRWYEMTIRRIFFIVKKFHVLAQMSQFSFMSRKSLIFYTKVTKTLSLLQFDKIIVVCTYPLARPANVLLFKDSPSGDVWFLLMYFHPSIILQSSCNKILKISSCKSLGEFTWTYKKTLFALKRYVLCVQDNIIIVVCLCNHSQPLR